MSLVKKLVNQNRHLTIHLQEAFVPDLEPWSVNIPSMSQRFPIEKDKSYLPIDYTNFITLANTEQKWS